MSSCRYFLQRRKQPKKLCSRFCYPFASQRDIICLLRFSYLVRFLSLVGPSGLEPPTSCLSGTRSNLLSYEPMWLAVSVSFTPGFGGDDGIRTHDPLLAGQVLSQLSYTPIGFLSRISEPQEKRRTLILPSPSVRVSAVLSSRAVSRKVFSPLQSLTSVFGMGTGGPSALIVLTYLLSLKRKVSKETL